MLWGKKNIRDLEFSDIEKLLKQEIGEYHYLDYKRDLPKNSKELAKDVSAFANSDGGVLIYGIEEKDNGKKSYVSVGVIGSSEIEEQYENKIIGSISPRPNVILKAITIPEEKRGNENLDTILVIYVPKSYQAVHMVVVNKEYRYYRRFEKSSVPMTEEEIRRKYEEVGEYEKTIEQRIDTIRKTHFEKVDKANEVGLMSLILSPMTLTRDKFNDRDKLNRFLGEQSDLAHKNKSAIYLKYMNRLDRHHNRFFINLEFKDREKPVTVFEIYYDGLISLGRTINHFDNESIYLNALYHDIYYTLDLICKIYGMFDYYGYIRIIAYFNNIVNKKLAIQKMYSNEFGRDLVFREELEKYDRIYDLQTIQNNIQRISIEILKPFYYNVGLNEPINLFKADGTPDYYQ